MASVRVPIAFTRIDRWLIGGLLVAGGIVAGLLWLSQALVAPPRPRVSESARPMVGLAVRTDAGTLRIVRAVGPARDAGLRPGDRIVRIDEKRAPSREDLTALVGAASAGQTMHFEARRGSKGESESTVLAAVNVAIRTVTPEDQGLPFEDLSFRNAEGLVLRGWYLPPPADESARAPAIAYGHGNASDRRDWLPVALAVHEAGFAQLLFDFTGRGESDGEVITLGAHEGSDLRAALDVLAARPEIDPLRLALGGRSMGAVAALFLAAEDARVKALVLDSPYADLSAVVDRVIGRFHVPPLLLRPALMDVAGWRAHYAPESVHPLAAMRKVKAPTLLFHGEQDTLVPFEDAKAFQSAAIGPLTLVPLVGLDHNSPRPESVQDRIVSFLKQTLPPARSTP